MTRAPQSAASLDFAGKGLVDVRFDDLLGDGEHKESRICGSATLTRRVERWPLLPHIGPDGDEVQVSTPCRIRFRIATSMHADAMLTFYRNLQLYKALIAHQYRYYEPFIAFWHSPNEGNWAISMDATPESLTGFWRREVRPGIERCEAAVRAGAERRARERRQGSGSVGGSPKRPKLGPRRSTATVTLQPTSEVEYDASTPRAGDDFFSHKAVGNSPQTAATALASLSLNQAMQETLQGGDEMSGVERGGPPIQSPVEQLRQEMLAENDATGRPTASPLQNGRTLSSGSKRLLETSQAEEEGADTGAISKEDFRAGYGRAVKVLLQIGEAMWNLHRRRVCLVVLRPEAFTVSPTPAPPGSWPDPEPLPFSVQMSRTATAVVLDGFDEGRIVTKLPSSPKTAQASLESDKAQPPNSTRTESHSLLDMADPILHNTLGLDETLDRLYDESTLRFHARYIAPEALAGRNSVGPLIDVYSFGVLAHELLSGKRWHEATHSSIDLLAVLNMHQTHPIGDLEDTLPSAPIELCEIIRKCLRVDADGRYLSMQSLLCDLHSLSDRIAGRSNKPFVVGHIDAQSRFDQKGANTLVDRDQHLSVLEGVFNDIKATSKVRAVCVWGTSGSGKSHLVDTWTRQKEHRGECLVAYGKYDQHLVKPLSGLVQVFDSLLTAIFSDPQEDHARWRARINDVLQTQSNIFLSLISPNWRSVLLGPDADTSDSSVAAETEVDWGQYIASFRTWTWSLLRLFGSSSRPLVVILDDVQWQEDSERELWRSLLSHPSRHLLHTIVLATYRSDTHPAEPFADTTMLETRPLDLASTSTVIRKALHIDGQLDAQMSFVATFLFATTKGNAFFTVNLLSALARDGVVHYDYIKQRWSASTAALPLYNDAGIDAFAKGVLRDLPSSVQAVLKTLACLPSRGVPIALVATIMEWSTPRVSVALQQASLIGCVSTAGEEVSFTHDRMHAAALSLIEDHEAIQLYLAVGNHLSKAGPAFIVTAVDAHLMARKLGDRSVHHDDLCRLIIVAIKRANRLASFDLARNYLRLARNVLVETYGEEKLWAEPPQRDMAFQLVPLHAEAGGALGELQEALDKVEEALPHAPEPSKRLEFLTLKLRLLALRHDGQEALRVVVEACRIAGVDISKEGTARRTAALPNTAAELRAIFSRALEQPRAESKQETINCLLLNIVGYAGPVLYSSLGIHGTRPFFEVALDLVLHDATANRQPSAGYICAYFGILGSSTLQTDYARAAIAIGRTVPTEGSMFEIHHLACQQGAMHVEAPTLRDISFEQAWSKAVSVDHVEIKGYVVLLVREDAETRGLLLTQSLNTQEAANLLGAGTDIARLVRKTAEESSGTPAIVRAALNSFVNLAAILEGKRRAEEGELPNNRISYVGPLTLHVQGLGVSADEWAMLEYAPMFALMAHVNQTWLDLFFHGDASRSVSQVQRLAEGGAGLLSGLEAQFLSALCPALRGTPLSSAEQESLDRFRLTAKAFSHLKDFQCRLQLVDALTSVEPWPVKVELLEAAIEATEANQSFLWAGFFAQTAAELVLEQTKSRRLAYGLGCTAQRLYLAANARGTAEFAFKRYPSKYSEMAKTSLLPTEAVDKVRHLSTPTTESSASDDQHLSKAATLEAKLNLDSILKTCLVLATEQDKHSLLQSLLAILLQLQRADYACLAIQDPSNQDLALDLVAAGSLGTVKTWDSLKLVDAGGVCPSSILLGVANTKQTRRLNDHGSAIYFKRDPFFAKGGLPKSAVCYPLRVQGKFVGVVYVSGRSPIAPSSETQVTVLATFAAIALEAHYSRSTLESIIQARTLQLTQALAHRSSFLTSVSHELRTPLFSIIGMLTVLESATDLSSTHLESLSMIRSSSQQLHGLIDNVLDLAKLESGSIKVDSKPFDLRTVAEEAVETLSYVAYSKGLYLVVNSDVSEDPPPLVGDPQRLRQCLLNLLANAVKFTSAGGVKVEWKVEREGDQVRIEISVTDSGCGITSSQMGKLFSAFSQLDPSLPGTGLGLTITRELARLQGGECWAESTAGEGSTFYLMFVCAIDTSQQVNGKIASTLVKKAVILSEGDAAVDPIRRNLMQMGVQNTTVTNSIEETITSRADLVITDLLRRHPSVSDLHRMQSSLSSSGIFYMMPAAAIGETLLQYDVPHSATLALPVKTCRLREIVQAVAGGDTGKKSNEAVSTQRKPAIDTAFAQTHPLKLLYVDDNKINVVVGLKILSRFGYRAIDAVYDGQQALDLLARKSYDAVFMDLQMPIMDGHEFMLAFRKRPEAASTPVIALTANCDESTKNRCMSEGFSYFLSKPLSIKDLTITLDRIYNSQRQH